MSDSPLVQIEDLKVWFPVKKGLLAKTYGYVRAVDSISLAVDKGETLGLVGESGCGKTTLGRAILGLERAHSGKILFDGEHLQKLDKNELRRIKKRMQIIFQDPLSSLNPRLNVLDIVTEGLTAFKMIEGTRRDHAVSLLKEVGLSEDAVFRYPHEFSGGQRQRINIARAIAMRPDFIVCDEPVSALDVSVQAQVINLMMDLRQRFLLSYLFISHDLSVVRHIADRVAVMYLGRIVEIGSTDAVIDAPKHPYTKALIAAIPEPGVRVPKKLVLSGEIPSPLAPPPGCRFHPRCPEAMEVCHRKGPQKTRQADGLVWCHLY